MSRQRTTLRSKQNMRLKTQRSGADSRVSRDFKGIWIPKELWLSRELTPIQKCLLAEIDSLDCGEGCYAKNKYLAEMFNTTPPRMANLISELRKKGFIEDISFDGRER